MYRTMFRLSFYIAVTWPHGMRRQGTQTKVLFSLSVTVELGHNGLQGFQFKLENLKTLF